MTLPQLVGSRSVPMFSKAHQSSNVTTLVLELLVLLLSHYWQCHFPPILSGQHYLLLLAVTVLILLTSRESLLHSEQRHCVITVQCSPPITVHKCTPAITADHTLTFAVTTLLALLVTAHHGLYSTLDFKLVYTLYFTTAIQTVIYTLLYTVIYTVL